MRKHIYIYIYITNKWGPELYKKRERENNELST
jgi:hypothetical protein